MGLHRKIVIECTLPKQKSVADIEKRTFYIIGNKGVHGKIGRIYYTYTKIYAWHRKTYQSK